MKENFNNLFISSIFFVAEIIRGFAVGKNVKEDLTRPLLDMGAVILDIYFLIVVKSAHTDMFSSGYTGQNDEVSLA